MNFATPLFSLALAGFVGLCAATGACAQAPAENPRPTMPIYLWSEKPLVSPDREYTKDQRTFSVDNPSITPFWPDPAVANGTAVIIFPGGAYARLALDKEGFDTARWLNTRGVTAFVAKYRLAEYGFPAPLLDGLRAVRTVRKNATQWKLNPNRIGVMGFSAGGHLAASVTTRFDFVGDAQDPLGHVSARPDFSVLGYAVITLEGKDVHAGSRQNLLGNNPDKTLVHENSLQFQVKGNVPPVFVFHGVDDQVVPVSNSVDFFSQVVQHNKRSELHVYQSNIHGLGMEQGRGSMSSWPQALELWLKQNQWLP
ncbi:MAG: alpha/beta hydrolase [Pseudomonadota bacterium]